MAQVIARVNRPALVMVHNKTLAAQLYQEFRRFFPHNAVEDLRQLLRLLPAGKAYLPSTDTYIEKEAIVNDQIPTGCGWPPPGRCSSGATSSSWPPCRASTGWARPSPTTAWSCRSKSGSESTGITSCGAGEDIQDERNDYDFARGPFASAATSSRSTRLVRGAGAADRPVRRRGGRAGRLRSADRPRPPQARSRVGLPEVALRDAARADLRGDEGDQGRTGRTAGRSWRPQARCSSRTGCTSGRCSTSRCCARSATATGSGSARLLHSRHH